MEFMCDGHMVEWTPKRLVIAGYTGKDQASVQKHIDELRELGVPAPPRVPMLYDLSPRLLQTTEGVALVRNDSSGEAEVVLLDIDSVWHVGLGSDHTDRALEAVSIHKSKELCAKPVTREIWTLASILDRWPHIVMRSWVTPEGGDEQLYQSGTLGEFMHPDDLLEVIRMRGYDTPGMAIYCGTLPLLGGFVYGTRFRAELSDSQTGRILTLAYTTNLLKDAEEE